MIMITKRSLKARVAELEDESRKHSTQAAKARNVVRSLLFAIEALAIKAGMDADFVTDESFVFPEELIHDDNYSATRIVEVIVEHPVMKSFCNRILELKAKAEKVPAFTETPFKRCPNCDSTDINHHIGAASGSHHIECRGCHMQGPKTDAFMDVKANGFDFATKAWNNLPRRTTDTNNNP